MAIGHVECAQIQIGAVDSGHGYGPPGKDCGQSWPALIEHMDWPSREVSLL